MKTFSIAALAVALWPLAMAQNPTGDSMTRWEWTDPSRKMHGVALGNWLMLEKWMNWDWFVDTCGNVSVVDEWGWMEAVGDETRAVSLLQDHWNNWVTEDHIRNMSMAGFNQ